MLHGLGLEGRSFFLVLSSMTDIQLTCVTKSHPQGGHEHITHAGNAAGTWPVSVIITNIDNKTATFYVQDSAGRRAYVGVVRPAGRPPYIRTYADGVWTDNLLALSACPLRTAA